MKLTKQALKYHLKRIRKAQFFNNILVWSNERYISFVTNEISWFNNKYLC